MTHRTKQKSRCHNAAVYSNRPILLVLPWRFVKKNPLIWPYGGPFTQKLVITDQKIRNCTIFDIFI